MVYNSDTDRKNGGCSNLWLNVCSVSIQALPHETHFNTRQNNNTSDFGHNKHFLSDPQ